MDNFEKLQMFLRMHRADIGMFIIRLALAFVFVAHSTQGLMLVLPDGLTTVPEVISFSFAIVELVASIMILSGFLISIASYSLIILSAYYSLAVAAPFYYILFDNNDGHSFLIIAACIGVALVGPGKIVLNKRYSHIASSLREKGVDKEIEIMGT